MENCLQCSETYTYYIYSTAAYNGDLRYRHACVTTAICMQLTVTDNLRRQKTYLDRQAVVYDYAKTHNDNLRRPFAPWYTWAEMAKTTLERIPLSLFAYQGMPVPN